MRRWFTFSLLQVKRIVGLQHLTAGYDTFHVVSQLFQLDVEVHFVLCAGELGTTRTGGRHQVAHLDPKGTKFGFFLMSVCHLWMWCVTYRFNVGDLVGLQTKVQVLGLHAKDFLAEYFVNT